MESSNLLRLIVFRFSFSNSRVVPHFITHRPIEIPQERDLKKRQGVEYYEEIIKPVEKCFLFPLVDDLEKNNYELVDAFYQPRSITDAELKGRTIPSKKRFYHVLCFTFACKEFAFPKKEFLKIKESLNFDFNKICRRSFWRTCVVKKQYLGTDSSSNHFVLTVNLTARAPRFYPDGQMVTQWQKDENGDRVGDSPLALMPDYCLKYNGGKPLLSKDISFENLW